MCHPYPTLTPAAIHQLADRTLTNCLGLRAVGRLVGVKHLIAILLMMAATTRTLFAVARRFSFSHQTARRALAANLPGTATLTARLVDGLHQVLALSRRDRRRRWTVAIDTHDLPYYGSRQTPGIIGGQKKEGTKYFFRYATAVLIHRHRRYTVGLLAVGKKGVQVHEIVGTLLDQIRSHGLTVGGVVLDSAFDSGDTILLLQQRGLSYTVPMRRKGSGSNRRNDCFSWPSGDIGTLAWETKKGQKPVETRVLVWKRAGQSEVKAYAFGGWEGKRAVRENRRAWLARRRYRERFGIETSYRQKNQGRGWTTSRGAGYRLLLEGIAQLMRQLWVRLTEEVARARGLKPTAWVGDLPLCDLLEGITDRLHQEHPLPTPKPPEDKTLEPVAKK